MERSYSSVWGRNVLQLIPTESKNMDRLRELVANLPEVPELNELVSNRCGNRVQYGVDDGDIVGECLFNIPGFASAQRVVMKAGTTFPKHNHEEWEYIICQSGEVELTVENKVFMLDKCKGLGIRPETPHSAIAVEDTVLICMCIPDSAAYPL